MSVRSFAVIALSETREKERQRHSLEGVRGGERCSVFDLRSDLVRVAVGELIASMRKGGMFSLFPSPSTTALRYLARFGLGDCSGVGGRGISHGKEVVDDASDDGESEGA